MKIAFTSCMDTVHDPTQAGWKHLADRAPDMLVLLGDSLYMDYRFDKKHLSRSEVRELPLSQFSQTMYERYAAQWNVAAFQQAIRRCTVHAVWDDHDFAWDNGHGAGDASAKAHVPAPHRRVSRRQFETWRTALRDKPAHYPDDPVPDGAVPEDLGSIAQTHELAPGVWLYLLDLRTFREQEGGRLLGPAQRAELDQALRRDGVHILASSTVLEKWRKEHPDDHAWLRAHGEHSRILVLSGDIHEPRLQHHGRVHEATASSMAQPKWSGTFGGKKTQVFGILDIGGDALTVQLHVAGVADDAHRLRIRRSDWQASF